jgi:hypothetical protein
MAVNNLNSGVGIQPTIVDAKGDLIAATANDAVNRLAVGTNGQVLVADSGETTGLKWNNPGSVGGLVHIETRTLTATSLENFNDVFSSTYDNYRILIRIIASTSTNTQIRLRVGGVDNSTANSYVTQNLLANSTTVSASRNTDTSGQLMGVETNLLTLGLIDISQPFLASPTGWYTLNMLPISNASLRNWAGTHNQTISYDGFTIFPASGNITGQISIYGYAKA